MKTKKSLWSISLSLIVMVAMVLGFGLMTKPATSSAFADGEVDEHIAFNVTVDDLEEKVIALPYQELIAVSYTVQENTGIDALQLTIEYDSDAFTLDHIVTLDTTALGAATVNDANIVFENTNSDGASYVATDDTLFTAYFAVNANATTATAYSFGFADLNDGNDFSNAWRIVKSTEESSTLTPVTINFTAPTVYIRGEYTFALDAEGKVYDGVAADNNEIEVDDDENPNRPNLQFVWFEQNGNYYTKLDENPSAVGTYYVVLEYEATNYYKAYCGYTDEGDDLYSLTNVVDHVAEYVITQRSITITIADKSSVYGDPLVALTWDITSGSLASGDNIDSDVVLTKEEGLNAGTYAITGAYNGGLYNVTFVDGTYTITQKEITITALDQSAEYTGSEPVVDQTAYTVVPDLELVGVVITKAAGVAVGTYTLTPSFNNANYDVTAVTGTFTITTNGLTQSEVDEWVANYVQFKAWDNEQSTTLTVTDHLGSYTKTYDGEDAFVYAIVNSTSQNPEVSGTVYYKVNDGSFAEIVADSENNFYAYKDENARVDTVVIRFNPGTGYAFEQGVNADFVITLTVNRAALTITATATAAYGDASEVISVDNGNGWVSNESYSTYSTTANAVKAYVSTDYVQGTNAGETIVVTWNNGAKAALEAVIRNYTLTLSKLDGVVAKKVVNANDYDFAGYNGEYDGVNHTLTVSGADAIISYTISSTDTVKDVADNGTYTATITLEDTDNYTFENGVNTNWEVANDYTRASKQAQVAITPKALTIDVAYTKTTATFSLNGFVNNETEAVMSNLAYSADNDQTANISGNVYTINGYVANVITVSATSTNANYAISSSALRNIRKVEYVAGDYDYDVSGENPELPSTEVLFNGFTVEEPEAVELNHYTFVCFAVANSLQAEEFDFTQAITENKTVYVIWGENDMFEITLYYMVDGDADNMVAVDLQAYTKRFYSDVAIRYDNELPVMPAKAWYKVEKWFTDEDLETEFVDGSTLSEDITLYANYKFNIGIGDVNANGIIDANDITTYRQWIVGGYDIITVESGSEWATVNSVSFDAENNYFVERVADCNAATAEAIVLGDNGHRDIRDVSTIRMALVGGYGFSVMEGKYVDGEEIIVVRSIALDNASDLLTVAKSGVAVQLADDITEENFIGAISNCKKDVVIDLNNHTLTLKSLSIVLSATNTGKIEIKNGSIRVAEGNGVSLIAPAGSVILDNVTLYDEDGQFTLQAANQSLHFARNVQFLKKGANDSDVASEVKVEKDTHVVVEAQAVVEVLQIVVTEQFVASQEEDVEISMLNLNEQANQITVVGNVNNNAIATYNDLVSAVAKGGEYSLSANVDCGNHDIVITKNFTLDLNGYNITFTDWGFDVRNNATFTIGGNGTVEAQEAALYAWYAGRIVVNGGNFVSNDNFVIGTNGSAGKGGNVITINGGSFTGTIQSQGNIACGIYVANNDTVTVNAGTFNITNGVGILARSGNTTVGEDVVFNVTGNGTLGKVGDSRVVIPTGKELVMDFAANYPAGEPELTNNNACEVCAVVENATELSSALANGYSVVLANDILPETAVAISANATVYGNGHKLKANISGNGTVTFNNVYTTNITVSQNNGFSGTLVFNGGVLDTDRPGTGDADAAFYSRNNPNGSFEFRDMTISANITKGIKIYNAKNIVIDGCEFDATNLNIIANELNSNIQSLSLVDIQIDSYATNIAITNSSFIGAPQGSIAVPASVFGDDEMADSDTGAAIKLKAEKGMNFGNVVISGNNFEDNYRDIVLGTAPYVNQLQYSATSASNGRSGDGLRFNTTDGWTIEDNTTNLTANVVAGRGVATLSYIGGPSPFNKYTTHVGNVGKLEGGLAIWTITDAFGKFNGTWCYVENGDIYTVSYDAGKAVLTPADSDYYVIDGQTKVYYATLAEAISGANGATIYLAKDITTGSDIVFTTQATLNLNEHDVVFTNGAGFSVYANGVLTIEGNGNVSTREVCLFAADGGSIIVNGGTYTSTDNFVIGSNGSAGRGGNSFTINAGTFNGGITSAGYVACGIYAANNDTVVVNGGTFNITNGVGILARSGNTTVKAGVVFNVSGNGELGKVGDSQVTIPSGEELVLDLKANYPGGVPTINNNTSYDVYVVVNGTYTFANDDASFHAARGVYDNVILTADLSDYLYVNRDMNLYLNGHTIDVSSTGYVAIYVAEGAALTINGNGNVIAREGCVMAFDGSSFVINGGTYTCTDNFVFGTNGTAGKGNNTITINAGTFNGGITSAGYVACGIYVANNDTVVVNGGTFNITNGVGILARSGNTTVKAGVVFNVSGNGELGKVGDSQVTVPSGEELVLDLKANYPGGTPTITNNSEYEVETIEA